MDAGAHRNRFGGPAGNELLTKVTAAVLVLLLVAIGVTVIHMHGLRNVHMLLGLLLIPPVLLKMASTGYRFARYYTRSRLYRLKGPPDLPMRALAVVFVPSTVAVFVTGVVLMFDGHKVGWLLEFHKVSFIVWVVLFGVHFLVYIPSVARSLAEDWTAERRSAVPGAGLRGFLVAISVGAGLGLALALVPTIDSWHR
jgi:hypothetical protein